MTDHTAAARQATFRQRRREEGLVELRLYVTEDHARLIREYAETLKEGKTKVSGIPHLPPGMSIEV